MQTADAQTHRSLTALFLAVAMAVVVGSALGFEHIGGYIPCALCLEQRTPYYIGAPLMLVAAIVSRAGGPAWAVRGLLAVGGLLMLYGLVLGVYHSGVEWHWWEGLRHIRRCRDQGCRIVARGSQLEEAAILRCGRPARARPVIRRLERARQRRTCGHRLARRGKALSSAYGCSSTSQ